MLTKKPGFEDRNSASMWRVAAPVLALLMLHGHRLYGQPDATTRPGDSSSTGESAQVMPHLTVDRQSGWVDVEARVVLREAGWLELLACTPTTRTHESILAVHALPSHIHLALMMLGIEPGQPMQWLHDGDEPQVELPRGPLIAVSILVSQDGNEVEIPANQWIVDQKTGQLMANNLWLFTGSFMYEQADMPPYQADVSGSVVSIVNFGDDMLARATDLTNRTDDRAWSPNTEAIPDVGTDVVLRLRPVNHPNNLNPPGDSQTGATTQPDT